jgi:cytochrome c oxidase assembly protein subunit 15
MVQQMAQQRALSPALGVAASTPNAVRIWLLVVAALIFLMVSLGGATRLTGSGLSITEWQPIMGAVPPLSDAAWQDAFHKYQQIPQYEHVNHGMTLAGFKLIFWWEWTHRFLARLIGAVFLLPFLYFLATGQIARSWMWKLGGIFALGGLQGFIGWYMVSSGLADRVSVSQYRLALHLTLAVAIFGCVLWVALSLDTPGTGRAPPQARAPWRNAAAAAIAGLVLVQIVAGAFVAGLKAGYGYNDWPWMDGELIPRGLGALSPWWQNLFENALTAQFDHRLIAYAITAAVLWHLWAVRRTEPTGPARRSALVLAGAVLAQATLGIWTLMAHVPIPLALLHQAGAVALFAVALWHWHTVRSQTLRV